MLKISLYQKHSLGRILLLNCIACYARSNQETNYNPIEHFWYKLIMNTYLMFYVIFIVCKVTFLFGK